MAWYMPLRALKSKGSQAARPGSLAGLAAARNHHQGQFFTSPEVVVLMYRIIDSALREFVIKNPGERIAIMDNSMGSGRLFEGADPNLHDLYGNDIDRDAVMAVSQVVEEVGFTHEFVVSGMESMSVRHMHVALINPPFSLTLSSPSMTAYPCCAFGRYGPGTSASSQAYALAQALDAAQLVVALLPSTFAESVANDPTQIAWNVHHRLRAHIDLPAGAFREEGTDVSTALLVFGRANPRHTPVRVTLKTLVDPLPAFGLTLERNYSAPRFRAEHVEDEGPAIHLPVTGVATVRVTHNQRWIGLRFQCGLVQAKVLNAVYRKRIRESAPVGHRHPQGFVYEGQGALDVEVHLAQADPESSLAALIETIRDAGGEPQVDPGFIGYFKRRIRQSRRQAMPFRHTVWQPDGVPSADADTLVATARKTMVANPKAWGSPVIQAGQSVKFSRNAQGTFEFSVSGRTFTVSYEDLYRDYEVTNGASEPGWVTVHAGLRAAYPELEKQYQARANALGLDKILSWTYQLDDCIEIAMKPDGAVVAWLMGLGKARLAIALIRLIGCRHGLIVTEAGLVDEMVMELKGLPIDSSEWQVISKVEQIDALRPINVISYERLRMKATHKKTYGAMLRRRIGVLIADEGDILSNPQSEQSRALLAVSAKRTIVATGTLQPNYPRDALPILALTCGDGTAAQPWGYRRGHLETHWRQSVAYASRGIDAFRDHFIETIWVTNAWCEDLLSGAKREVPRVNNITDYRGFLAPHVLRRVDNEPDVAKFVTIPVPSREVIEIPWDTGHLAHYLAVAEDFAAWYNEQRRREDKRSNLVAVLARIRAVSFASDYPQHVIDGFGSYMPLTSKQRWLVDELSALNDTDAKVLCYFENPGQCELIAKVLRDHGVECITYHGEKPIHQRIKEMNNRFRFGPVKIALVTLGTFQKGLNLSCVNEILLPNRSWSATVEEQAIRRALRPQQKRHVRVRYLHHPSGIDEYKDQLVDWKRVASKAGLDWATPSTDGEEFHHMDTILARFCDDLAKLYQVKRFELKAVLKQKKGAVYA